MYFMYSRFSITKLVSTRVAVLYSYTKASKPLDFSICFFLQNSVLHCPERVSQHPYKIRTDFSASFSKMRTCLVRSCQQLCLSSVQEGSAAPLPPLLTVLTRLFPVLLFILQRHLSGILQPPISFRVCLFFWRKGNSLACASSLAIWTV